MARTEIKLNGVYYKINRLPTQTLANQMASKVGQGQSEYGDLTTWSAWIQEDWQDGVGRIKPHRNGGFLYGEAESRVPGQMILPQRMDQLNETFSGLFYNNDFVDLSQVGSYTVGAGGSERLAMQFFTPSTGMLATQKVWIYASIPVGVELTFAFYTKVSGNPGTLLASTTYTPPEENTGYYWHGVSLPASGTLTPATYHYFVVYPTSGANMFSWGYANSGAGSARSYSSSTWGAASPIKYPIFTSNFYPLATTSTNSGAGLFRFNGNLYCYSNSRVWKYDSVGVDWDDVSAITNITAVTSAVNFGDKVYFGNEGGDGDYCTMNTSEVISDAGADGHIFAKFRGYLWRANANYVEYTSDGSTWEPTATVTPGSPITVSDTSDPITGLVGLNDKMYATTTAGIVPIFAGDIVYGFLTWGSLDPQNGMSPIEFEGAIYVIVGGRVIRYTEDGTTQDVWMTRDSDLLTGRIGRVWNLTRTNNWLVALVGGADADDKPTIWAFQKSSWHHIATLPSSTSSTSGLAIDYGLYYDRATSRLWAITPDFVTYYWHIPDYSINPYNDPLSRYMATAWVEWDWFDSQVLEAEKDFDSVTIMGENFSSTRYVDVYWQDDASTTWEYLGRVNSNHGELRWSIDGGTRPNSRRLKLGFLIATEDSTETPRIRAFRVKYHLQIRDWFRWNLQIDVSGRSGAYQMLGDGTRNTLTASQIKAAIDALITQVPPFVYQDVDGTSYEVKVLDGNFQYTKSEYNEATSSEYWEGVYSLVIEQVTAGTYTAP